MLMKLVSTYNSFNKHPPDTDDTDSSVVVKLNVNRVLNKIRKKNVYSKNQKSFSRFKMLDALLLLLAIILIVYALRKREQSNKAYFDRKNLIYYSPTSLMSIFFKRFTPIEFADALYNGLPNEQ